MNIRKVRLLIIFLLVCFSFGMGQAAVKLRRHHPLRYTVKAGDTLWSIASKFLIKPWQWQQLWENNKHVRNPHLLYPGNVIQLIDVDGRSYLRLVNNGTIKLSPKIRWEKLSSPIPTIPVDQIKNFLSNALILPKGQLDKYPYVLALGKQHVGAVAGNEIYVRGLTARHIQNYLIYKAGERYQDPATKKTLGYEAVEVAKAKLIKAGNPATLVITSQSQGVYPGYRLMPDKEGHVFKADFVPRPPKIQIKGKIIALLDKGIHSVGHLSVVALNLGTCNGMHPGYVLSIMQPGERMRDRFAKGKVSKSVKLPDTHIGELMIFRTFYNTSYALVLQTKTLANIGDEVETPAV